MTESYEYCSIDLRDKNRPLNLVDLRGQLWSRMTLSISEVSKIYAEVDDYSLVEDAPILTTNTSTNASITDEGQLYDLYNRKIIITTRRIIQVFDHASHNGKGILTLDEDGLATFSRTNNSEVIARNIKMIVPTNRTSQIILLTNNGEWKYYYYGKIHNITGPADLPNYEDIIEVSYNTVDTAAGRYDVIYNYTHNTDDPADNIEVFMELTIPYRPGYGMFIYDGKIYGVRSNKEYPIITIDNMEVRAEQLWTEYDNIWIKLISLYNGDYEGVIDSQGRIYIFSSNELRELILPSDCIMSIKRGMRTKSSMKLI